MQQTYVLPPVTLPGVTEEAAAEVAAHRAAGQRAYRGRAQWLQLLAQRGAPGLFRRPLPPGERYRRRAARKAAVASRRANR